mmetsp:Transcript_23907/g.53577  ORF Transcript_23907/g.53577 Transcript_23907/m.53577 type:complete len:251 (-) Transcript_23907:98-850(-)
MKRILFGSNKTLPCLPVPPVRKFSPLHDLENDDDAMSFDTESGDPSYASDSDETSSGAFVFSVVVVDGKRITAGRSGRIRPKVHLQFSCPGYFSQIATTSTQSTTWPIWREGFMFSTPAENVKDINVMRHAMVMILIEDEISNRLLGQSWVSLEEITMHKRIDKEYHFCPTSPMNPSLRLALSVIDDSCTSASVSQYDKPVRHLRSKLGATFHATRLANLADEMKQFSKGTVSLLKIIDCDSFMNEHEEK